MTLWVCFHCCCCSFWQDKSENYFLCLVSLQVPCSYEPFSCAVKSKQKDIRPDCQLQTEKEKKREREHTIRRNEWISKRNACCIISDLHCKNPRSFDNEVGYDHFPYYTKTGILFFFISSFTQVHNLLSYILHFKVKQQQCERTC